jgi:hypothetical protein
MGKFPSEPEDDSQMQVDVNLDAVLSREEDPAKFIISSGDSEAPPVECQNDPPQNAILSVVSDDQILPRDDRDKSISSVQQSAFAPVTQSLSAPAHINGSKMPNNSAFMSQLCHSHVDVLFWQSLDLKWLPFLCTGVWSPGIRSLSNFASTKASLLSFPNGMPGIQRLSTYAYLFYMEQPVVNDDYIYQET